VSASETVQVTQRENATWIGVNRPDKRNALDLATSRNLRQALEAAQAAGPTVLVLHSTTPGIFVSGTDIGDLAQRGVEEALNPVNVRLFEQLASFRWPTVAVIDGPAFGGGLELALACDLRVGTPSARFATPEPSLGIMAGAGGNHRVSNLAGLAVARRMIYVGDVVEAEAALACGLLDRLAQADELDATVDAIVASIARRSWRALELSKLALRLGQRDTTSFDLVAQGLLYESEDAAARINAFLERRRAR
jgi:enoyl-CoA hydratase